MKGRPRAPLDPEGILAAVVTPFDAYGAVDLAGVDAGNTRARIRQLAQVHRDELADVLRAFVEVVQK